MQIRLDRDVNALYIDLQEGEVDRTLELTEMVYLDVNKQGDPLGVEFVNADDFIPFLRERLGEAEIPPQLREVFGMVAPR
jgi:uncharacterized protein YuzE